MTEYLRQIPTPIFVMAVVAYPLVDTLRVFVVRSVKGRRLPSVEVLLNSGHITNLIERGDVPAIKEALERSLSPGSQSFEQSLYGLLQAGRISREVALDAADSKNNLLWLINNSGRPQQEGPNAGAAEEPPRRASFADFTLNI